MSPFQRRVAISMGVGLAVGALALYRLTSTTRSGSGGPSSGATASSGNTLLDQARQVFRAIPMEPAGPILANQAEVSSRLSRAEVRGQPPSGRAAAEVLTDAAEFLYWRFGQPSAEAYWEWRLSTGMKPKTMEQMRREWQVDDDFHQQFGGDPPATTREMFARLWSIGLTAFNGTGQPVAFPVAAEPDGSIVLTFSTLKRPGDSGEIHGTAISTTLLEGAGSATLRSWFGPPTALRDAIRSGPIAAATVALVLEFADGQRRPLIMRFALDAAADRWHLWTLNQTQLGGVDICPLEY